MEWVEWILLALLGLGTGAYGVLIGAGGGFILVPVLVIFFNIEPEIAAGTSLALVAANSFSGGMAFRRLGLIDRRSAILFAMAAMPGAVLAPLVHGSVGGNTFRILFGILLIALALTLVTRQRLPEDAPLGGQKPLPRGGRMTVLREITSQNSQVYRYRFNEVIATSFNFVLGFISSFFGTGGGFIRTPILVYVFKFPVQVAVATSIVTLSFTAVAGTITHAILGHVNWFPTFVMAGIGLIIGGQIGAHLTSKLKGAWILRLLLVVVLVLGIWLITEGLLNG